MMKKLEDNEIDFVSGGISWEGSVAAVDNIRGALINTISVASAFVTIAAACYGKREGLLLPINDRAGVPVTLPIKWVLGAWSLTGAVITIAIESYTRTRG